MNIIWYTIIVAVTIIAGVFYMEYIEKFFNKVKQCYTKSINWIKQCFKKSEPPKKRGRPRKKK